MRLFVGLRPSEAFRRALSELQGQLQDAGIAAKYLNPANLHMTLAFIGEWPENVAGILPSVKQPFSLTLSNVGLFREEKVIWAGVEASEPLDQLAECVRNNLSAAGVPFDPKPFVPHITLGRKPIVPVAFDFSDIIIPAAEMTVSDVFLYRSDRGENGMVYSAIGSASEKGGASSIKQSTIEFQGVLHQYRQNQCSHYTDQYKQERCLISAI
jgi:2'-5' RNA ligase